MSISVACQCGRRLLAEDRFVGKRAKCPECGSLVIVPLPVAICPSCTANLPTKAVLCVQCGLDLQTGKKLASASGASSENTQQMGLIPSRPGTEEQLRALLATVLDVRIRQLVKEILVRPFDLTALGSVIPPAEDELKKTLGSENNPVAVGVLAWGLRHELGDPWSVIRIIKANATPKLIPTLVALFSRKRTQTTAVLDYLTCLNDGDLFEPLLAFFRAATRTDPRADGRFPWTQSDDSKIFPNREGEREDDAILAGCQLGVPQSIQRLRKTCTTEEVSRILALASLEKTLSIRPELIQVLGELRTPAAMGGLIHLWLYAKGEDQASARLLLVKAGPAPHLQLLNLFRDNFKCTERKPHWFEDRLEEILGLLEETGDLNCARAIGVVLDGSEITEKQRNGRVGRCARKAIAVINGRI